MPVNEMLNRFLHRLTDNSGNVAIVFALSLPVVLGGAGLGVETSYWYYKDRQLQAAADAAAYTGAIELIAKSDDDDVLSAATSTATNNGFNASIGSVDVNAPPTSGPNTDADAVEVILSEPLNRFFSSLFTDAAVDSHARAVAIYSAEANACMLALDNSASDALQFSGTADVTLSGCALMSNSVASDAVSVQGSANVTVDCVASAGGVDLSGTVDLTSCDSVITNTIQANDPYEDLPVPTASGPCLDDNAAVLSPGNYCKGLSVKGNVTMLPGTYVVSGGDFKVNGNANLSGSGVTVYLSGTSRVSMNGTATVDLSAPTSGTYSGILFFADPTNSASAKNSFNGNATSLLTGVIYAPSQKVEYAGNFSGVNGCTQVVAATIDYSGSMTIGQDCTSLGMASIPAIYTIQIVE